MEIKYLSEKIWGHGEPPFSYGKSADGKERIKKKWWAQKNRPFKKSAGGKTNQEKIVGTRGFEPRP
ncbi:hypothetical protein COT07_00480 [Candidatus Woesearchaeota archaeon CG07_land_8_20_14_0_80_44_23]|nr:MAG: hypothetical protein COT07_00480 [Candidatus Woesearchaeota archaeon CG07_land_8_20_14_0_80_44_23]